MDEVDDGGLVQRIVGAAPGEAKEAETELVRRFAPRIRLYGLRHLRDETTTQDLTQEVLATTLEAVRAGRIREPERLASFVLGTCRMLVWDQRRGARRQGRLLATFGEGLAPDPAAGPALDAARLADCLAQLAERERVVVVLTFYADRSGDEIARELAMSPGHVRVVRHRALVRLRNCLGASA